MSRLGEYIHQSLFVRNLMAPDVRGIANPVPNIEEENPYIKVQLRKIMGASQNKSETHSVHKGLVSFIESHTGRHLTDTVVYESEAKWKDYDSVLVETRFKVKRELDGRANLFPCKRDNLYWMPYFDCERNFALQEFYVMIDEGKRVLHYSEVSPRFETFELKVPGDLGSGIIEKSRKIFDEEDFDFGDPALIEMYSLLHDDSGKSLLLRRRVN